MLVSEELHSAGKMNGFVGEVFIAGCGVTGREEGKFSSVGSKAPKISDC
jgi:hypothetical protein